MKVSNKKVISTLMVILMVPIVSLPCTASASNINNDAQLSPGGLAGKYLAVSTQLSPTGTEIKTINNVDVLRNKLYASNANLSDVEVAKLLYKYMGESENVIDTMPREKLLEALTFTGCVQTTNYIRYKQDGSRELLSRIAVLQDLEGVSGLTTAGIKLLAGSKQQTQTVLWRV